MIQCSRKLKNLLNSKQNKKSDRTTAVTRNGEKCGKFTFFFRKKFYLSGKYSVPKFATSCSRETLAVSLAERRKTVEKMKHYQEIVDEIFGNLYKHRTLRTLFDPNSSEWNETTIEKKLEILKRILESNKITFEQLIAGYRNFYKNELANKEHVLNSLESGILILLQNSL